MVSHYLGRMSSGDCCYGVVLNSHREISGVVTGGVSGVIFNSACTHCVDRRVLGPPLLCPRWLRLCTCLVDHTDCPTLMAYVFLSVMTITSLAWKVIPAATLYAATAVITVAKLTTNCVRTSIVANFLSCYLHFPSRLCGWDLLRNNGSDCT